MKIAWQLVFLLTVGVHLSCSTYTPDEQFIREKIPIKIQGGKPITFEIHSLSGNGENCVGIRCSPQEWYALTNVAKAVTVRLKSSSKKNTQIGNISPGSEVNGFLYLIKNTHYLFAISGEHRAKATVEIIFPYMQAEFTNAEIIVCKTPIDTKP
jgi:hypothetical protein